MAELKDRPVRSRKEKARERRELGWVRQSAVRWLNPGILARAAVEAGVSYTFGKFADKREAELVAQDAPLDCSGLGGDELWVDFLSDTGDGWEATQTMAWLLARPQLSIPGGESLRRGDLLLLGGDQVYPSAEHRAYEDRFIGPFTAASDGSAGGRPMFAIPGNHDWYDGLTSFMRIFCRPDWIGGRGIGDWTTRQTRSYWALKVRPGWWIWATDIQLDTYMDNPQLEYFTTVGKQLGPEDRVILITAKPSWVKVEPNEPEPPSWRYLAEVERELIVGSGARLVLTVSGDLHHYSRYEPDSAAADGPVRVTAGGGGAYLSATHTLPERRELSIDSDREPARNFVPYRRREIFPRAEDSRRLRWGVLRLPLDTPWFGVVMGAVYALLGATALGALNATGGLAASADGGFSGFLDAGLGGAFVVVAVLIAALLTAYTDLPLAGKFVVGPLETAAHAALLVLAVYAALLPFSAGAPGAIVALAALAACFAVGFLAGSTVFAATILAIHIGLGGRAARHTNEVFAAQAIGDYKNFLRLRFDRDGLTVYPLGVERICRHWRREPGSPPRFTPREEEPRVALIDDPLTFEPPRAG